MRFLRKLFHLEPQPKAATKEPRNLLAGFSREDINRAALKLVHGRVPYCFQSYLGGSVRACDDAMEVINDLREEYKNYKPDIIRKEVMGWLDFYENRNRDTRRDCESGESAKRLEKHRNERQANEDNALAVLEKLKHPTKD